MMMQSVALLFGCIAFVMGAPARREDGQQDTDRSVLDVLRELQITLDTRRGKYKDDPACPADHKCKFGQCSTAEATAAEPYRCICGKDVGGKYCEKEHVCKNNPCASSSKGDRCMALTQDPGYMCYSFKRFLRVLRYMQDGMLNMHLRELGMLDDPTSLF